MLTIAAWLSTKILVLSFCSKWKSFRSFLSHMASFTVEVVAVDYYATISYFLELHEKKPALRQTCPDVLFMSLTEPPQSLEKQNRLKFGHFLNFTPKWLFLWCILQSFLQLINVFSLAQCINIQDKILRTLKIPGLVVFRYIRHLIKLLKWASSTLDTLYLLWSTSPFDPWEYS